MANLSFYNENKIIIGVDEVGRGCLAGDIFVCALIIKNHQNFHKNVNDSKKLSFKKRIEIYNHTNENDNVIYSISQINSNRIDEINILNATMEGIKFACDDLIKKINHYDAIIIDGNKAPKELNAITIIKGDEKYKEIALASIIAKVSRDLYMIEIAKKYPEYNFEKHFGYGTKKHFEAIKNYGIIANLHRKTFLKSYI
jgi:ribonuclease HII